MMDCTNNVYDLDKLVGTYNIGTIYEQYKRHEFIQKLSKYKLLNDTSVLELGAADGQMTEILTGIAQEVVAVDGSGEFIRLAKERLKDASNVVFYESFFERFSIEKKFDVIIMHHVLEHVENPVEVLTNIKPLIKKRVDAV